MVLKYILVRCPLSLIENLLSEIKFTKGSLTPKTKQQGGKKNIAIRDTIPALSVYYKGNGILYKTNYNFNKFFKNHQSFPYKKEEKRFTEGSAPV